MGSCGAAFAADSRRQHNSYVHIIRASSRRLVGGLATCYSPASGTRQFLCGWLNPRRWSVVSEALAANFVCNACRRVQGALPASSTGLRPRDTKAENGRASPMGRLQVLVSGAGIAGCTLAYWLTRNGHSVTVVERSGSLRSSGSPVDVRGPALDVARRMNVATRLCDASIRLKGMTLLDSSGRQVARVDIGTLRASIDPGDLEIARGELARILHEASADDANYIFGDSITALTQDEGGVDVSFERSRPTRFDLVIGADGLHSMVRDVLPNFPPVIS
jgi:hypothetical protein